MTDVVGLILGVCLAACVWILCIGYNVINRWRYRHIPGPKPQFLFGNLQQSTYGKFHYTAQLDWPKQYGAVFKFFLGWTPYVVVTDPELVEIVGTRKFVTYHDRHFLPVAINFSEEDKQRQRNEILWAKGKYWAGIRAGCEPLFHSKSLKQYAPLMHESIGAALDSLKQSEGSAVDITHLLHGLTLSIVGRAAFGVDLHCQGEKESPLAAAARWILTPPPTSSQLRIIALLFPPIKPLLELLAVRGGLFMSDRILQTVKSIGYIVGTSKALLNNARHSAANSPLDSGKPVVEIPADYEKLPRTRQAQLQGQAAGAADHASIVPSPDSFFPKMINTTHKERGQEAKPLTDLQIAAQGYIFVLAGQDTTANGLSAVLYELAANPATQQRLVEEVDTFPGGGRLPEYDDIPQHFKYVEAAFQESMRMHPPVNALFITVRTALTDTTLGGYRIPKGTPVCMNQWGMAMDEKLFPEPEAFKPERFLPGTPGIGPETRSAAAHIPFGYGPHGCVGKRFAVEEAVFFLVRLFQKYTVSLDTEHHPPSFKYKTRSAVTLAPEGGIWLKFHPRAQSRAEE